MAASANQSGNQEAPAFKGNPSNANSAVAANAAAKTENSGTVLTLKHNPGLAVEWSPDEQSILEENLRKYATEPNIVRYAKIAMKLHDKTVRDVALRCRWMSKKESGKRRKDEHMARKNKEKKEKVVDPSTKPSTHVAARPNVPPYALPMPAMDNDDGISCKDIGGPTGQLLEQNEHILNQIVANLTTFQMQDNYSLFCQGRDNILEVMNELNDMPGIMNQMPPLPVKMDDELADAIFPRTTMPTVPPRQP